MRRREALVALAALGGGAVSLGARAQARRSATIGLLSPNPAPPPEQRDRGPVIDKLRKLGWVLGDNLTIERPEDPRREDALPELAAGLVRKGVDVIWAVGPQAAVTAARATTTIPIVFWGVAFPVEQGLIDSLARPGRNLTGVAFFASAELFPKVLEYLKLVVPGVVRVAGIFTPSAVEAVSGKSVTLPFEVADSAARRLGFEYRRHFIRRAEDLDGIFRAMLDERAQAIAVGGTTVTWRERQRIVEFANRNRLPSAFNQDAFADAGGLFAYGASSLETTLQTVDYVDRVLRGARPAEIPVELPSRYELVINLRTAKALGLAIPPGLLLRADRVIE